MLVSDLEKLRSEAVYRLVQSECAAQGVSVSDLSSEQLSDVAESFTEKEIAEEVKAIQIEHADANQRLRDWEYYKRNR